MIRDLELEWIEMSRTQREVAAKLGIELPKLFDKSSKK